MPLMLKRCRCGLYALCMRPDVGEPGECHIPKIVLTQRANGFAESASTGFSPFHFSLPPNSESFVWPQAANRFAGDLCSIAIFLVSLSGHKRAPIVAQLDSWRICSGDLSATY